MPRHEIPSLNEGDLQENVTLAVTTVAALIPVLGGPVSNLINGLATRRQQRRFTEVILGLDQTIRDGQARVDEEYVRSEDFEELLEETLRRAVRERNKKKRCVYRDFLASDMAEPAGSYDEKLRFLRTLEELQPDHLHVLKALGAAPEKNLSRSAGSPMATLRGRLPDIEPERLSDLLDQLDRMAMINAKGLAGLTTLRGAQELAGSITPYGNRFLRFL